MLGTRVSFNKYFMIDGFISEWEWVIKEYISEFRVVVFEDLILS